MPTQKEAPYSSAFIMIKFLAETGQQGYDISHGDSAKLSLARQEKSLLLLFEVRNQGFNPKATEAQKKTNMIGT